MKGLVAAEDRIVTGGADGDLHLLDGDGQRLGTAHAHSDIVNDVAVAPDGRVASVSRDTRVCLWDPDTNRTYTLGEHDHWSMCVAWSPTGDRVATGSEDGTVRLWSPEGGAVDAIQLGHPVNGIDWQGGLIAAASGDRALYLLDPAGAVVREMPKAGQMLWDTALDDRGERVAWVGRDRLLRIAAVDNGDAIVVPAHTDQIWGVSWDGDRVITAGADGVVGIWSHDGAALERIEVGPWARRAVAANGAVSVATEEGDLVVFEDDGRPVVAPPEVTIPETPRACPHWQPRMQETDKPGCEECGSPQEMRLCVTCGHVGCCESQLAHSTKHWLDTGHPNTVPAPAGEFAWKWCYADDMYVKRVAA